MTTLEAEQQVVEHGYTLGAFNEHAHSFIVANAKHGYMMSCEANHLRYVKGRGVVKIEEATCSICEAWGLNDGKWHEVPSVMS